MNFQDNLHALIRAGWTQGRIAEAVGTTQATVSRWRNGQDARGSFREKVAKLVEELPEMATEDRAKPSFEMIKESAVDAIKASYVKFLESHSSNDSETLVMDTGRIIEIGQAVNLFLAKNNKELPPEHYAELVFVVYNLYPNSPGLSELAKLLENLQPNSKEN